MPMKVRALYHFTGEPNTSELSLNPEDILTVTSQDVGEGWWEGRNSLGLSGIFPAAFVEEIDNQPPSVPDYAQDCRTETGASDNHNYQPPIFQQSADTGDEWDDEWDDDSEGDHTQTVHGNNTTSAVEREVSKSGSAGNVSVLGRSDGTKGTFGMRLNRFNAFARSGGESYIFGTLTANVQDADKVYICESENGIIWNPIAEPYSCIVASPKKETKLKGLKSFIAYQITPSFNNLQVSRRYKHFHWLHERFERKFSLIPIPALPDKQISGRYEEHFIERRRVQLQTFVDSVCRHPVLSQCEVWQHFMTCTDEKRWKAGKRKAEKDELVGARFYLALQAPQKTLKIFLTEYEIDKSFKFINGMDGAMKNLVATGVEQTKKHQGPYKREFQKIGHAFLMFGQAAEVEESGSRRGKLAGALKATGEAYHHIGNLVEEQPNMDWEPLGDILHSYKGIISSFPDILLVHKAYLQKRKECEKMTQEHRMEAVQLMEVIRRGDVLSYSFLAEINHFHCVRTSDFREAMQKFLQAQIYFYQEIVEKLKETLHMYEE